MYKINMMTNSHFRKVLMTAVFAVGITGLPNTFAQAQTPINTVCKTGLDADLPAIKTKVANMAEDLKHLKQAKQNSRASTSALREEILAIDQELGPWRTRHKTAAALAGESASTYALYKAEWIDTGEFNRLNDKINFRKTKHQDYKQARAQYQAETAKFEALGAKYQHIARDLLDSDRDCAGAKAALE